METDKIRQEALGQGSVFAQTPPPYMIAKLVQTRHIGHFLLNIIDKVFQIQIN